MAKAKRKNFSYRLSRWRHWVQAGFLLVWLDPLLLRLHSVCGPAFHCHTCPLATFACPIGVLANFSALHVIPYLTIGMLIVVGGLVGSFVCGWLCPFGFLQDMIGKVPTPKLKLPRWSGYVRYAALGGLVLAVPFFLGKEHPLFFCSLCPAGALEGAGPNIVGAAMTGNPVVWPNALKIGIVVLILVAMFFSWRPWCRLFCPLGAIYTAFNRFSVVFLRHRPEKCNGCDLCEERCKYGAQPSKAARDPACIRCLDCTRCGSMSLGALWGKSERTGAGAAAETAPASSD